MTLVSHSSRRWAPTAGALARRPAVHRHRAGGGRRRSANGPGGRRARARARTGDRRGPRRPAPAASSPARCASSRPASRRSRAPSEEQAQGLLGRPTDPGDTQQPGGPYTAPPRTLVGLQRALLLPLGRPRPRTRRRWPAAHGNNFPDYIDELADAFETSYEQENVDLGWTRSGRPTATLGGCAGGGDPTRPTSTSSTSATSASTATRRSTPASPASSAATPSR